MMRPAMIMLASLTLLPAGLGCTCLDLYLARKEACCGYTAGRCDCDPGCDRCNMYGIGTVVGMTPIAPPAVEVAHK